MTIEIEIQKKHFYLLASIFIFIIAVSLVIAYRDPPDLNTDYYNIIGHSPNEINWEQFIPKLITENLCLNDPLESNCKSSWSSGTTYNGEEGISISDNTISISNPTTTLKGGVKKLECSSTQKLKGIDGSGNPLCEGDIRTITFREITSILTCSSYTGVAVCSCSKGWGFYQVTATTGRVFIGYAAASPAYPPRYPNCYIGMAPHIPFSSWTSFSNDDDVHYFAVVGNCGTRVSATYQCQKL